MPSVIYIDGIATPAERAVVPITDRGFLYGDTVFETLRVYAGRPHLLADHLVRLRASADSVGIPLGPTDAELASEVHAAVAASGESDAVVRVTLSRGEGLRGIDPRRASRPRRIVHVEPLSAPLRDGEDAPVSLRRVTSRRGADLAPAAKIGAYVDGILALRAAQAAGDDDAVLVDASGELLEATTANVFVVNAAGEVATPSSGAVFPGLTRREVIRIAREKGLVCTVRPILSAEIQTASELFLTSSVREIVPVFRVDGVLVGAGSAGPITTALSEAYRAGARRGL